MERDGTISHSFGADTAWYRDELMPLLVRPMARADDGSVWVASSNEYLIERWNAAGARVGRIKREVEWFPPTWRPTYLHPDTMPATRLGGVWQEDDVLWVLLRVGDVGWAEGLERRAGESGMLIYTPRDSDRVYDTIIEVLDARTGALVQSRRFAESFGTILPDGRVTHVRYDELGRPFITLRRLWLERPD